MCLQFISEEEKWALQTRRVLPVSDEPAPVMFLTHCHPTFKKTYRDHASLSTALQSDLLSPPSTAKNHGIGPRDKASRTSVETHSTGQLGGQVPSLWLEDHLLVICPACSRSPPNATQLATTQSAHARNASHRMSTKSSPLASPSEPHILKAAQEASPTTTHGTGQQFLSILKAGAPSGTQGQTKTANARPNDGSGRNGLKGAEVPCGKNHVRHPNANPTPSSRHQTLLTTMTTSRRGTHELRH